MRLHSLLLKVSCNNCHQFFLFFMPLCTGATRGSVLIHGGVYMLFASIKKCTCICILSYVFIISRKVCCHFLIICCSSNCNIDDVNAIQYDIELQMNFTVLTMFKIKIEIPCLVLCKKWTIYI